MANATPDNTLPINPAIGSSLPTWDHQPQPDNNQAAADLARQKIANLNKPTYQGSVPNLLASVKAQPLPSPVSPAAQQLHQLPTLPQMPAVAVPKLGKAKPIFSALATFLFILALFKAPVLLNQLKYLINHSNTPPIITTGNTAVAETVPPNPIITIPKINVSAPVIYPTTTANSPNYDPELEQGVVHYPNTALPGQNGNTVIFGHSSNDWWQPGNYKFVFVLLDKLVPGDTFSVNYNSKRYIYSVTNTKIVEATDVGVLSPTPDPTITLITCWPAGTSLKRQIIQAKQISPTPQGSAAPTTVATPSTQILPSGSPSFLQEAAQFWQGIKDSITGRPTTVTAPTQNSTTGPQPSISLPGAK